MSRTYASYNQPTWYRCSRVRPPVAGEYIVTCRDAIKATVLTYENGKWFNDNREQFDVIAWMFLPGAYRAEER